jgi:hypothetical protein
MSSKIEERVRVRVRVWVRVRAIEDVSRMPIVWGRRNIRELSNQDERSSSICL